MTTQDLSPMPSSLRALIDADAQRPGPSDAVRASVFATLGVTAGLLPAAGAAGLAHATKAAATAKAASGLGALSTLGRLALLAKAPLVSIGLGAVLGGSVTAYVVTRPAVTPAASQATPSQAKANGGRSSQAIATAPGVSRAATSAPTEAPPAPAEPEAAIVGGGAPSASVGSSIGAMPHRPSPAATSSFSNDRMPSRAKDVAGQVRGVASGDRLDVERMAVPAPSALGAEQALLDPARAALARGDGAGALQRLDLHLRRFPAGVLSQEREAMAIQALVLTGDRDHARARAGDFRARYPHSLLWPMIDATLRSHP